MAVISSSSRCSFIEKRAGAGALGRGASARLGSALRGCGLLHALAALDHVVAVAAGIFHHVAVAFDRDGAGDQPVEEIAVVADQQQRALVFGQHVLQQVERVHVEVVGRLVQHDQVAGLGEQLGQHQARALAAGQQAHRHGRLPLVEQEVAQVADDVARPAVDDDGIAAGRRQRLPQGALEVEALPPLVEIDRPAMPMPSRTSPLSGAISPVSSLMSVVLPAPLGPRMPMRSPRMMRVEKPSTILSVLPSGCA